MDLQDKSREGGPKGTGCECSCCGARPLDGSTPPKMLPPATLARGTLAFPGPQRLSRPVVSRRRWPAASPSSRPPRWYLHVFPQRAGVRV